MAEPTTPMPTTDDTPHADERTTLVGFLDFYRIVLLRKIEGVSEEQARLAACPPSDMSLLGLIRHMAEVERIWAKREFLGRPNEPIFYGDAHPDGDVDGDFHPSADATIAEAVEEYHRQIADADAIYGVASLDDLVQARHDDRPRYSLRWIYVHLIEEYARHCGHADLLREAVDGVIGD